MGEYFTKKDAEEFKEDIKRYLGVLAEDFQHKLGFVIDGQMDIKREVENLKSDVGNLKSEVGSLKSEVGKLKNEVGSLKSEVGGLGQKVDMVYDELIAHRDNTEVHVQQVKKKRR
jgi:archaellum component FlaC